jgi:hypothetical protein
MGAYVVTTIFFFHFQVGATAPPRVNIHLPLDVSVLLSLIFHYPIPDPILFSLIFLYPILDPYMIRHTASASNKVPYKAILKDYIYD